MCILLTPHLHGDILVYQSMVCFCVPWVEITASICIEFNFIYSGSLKIRYMTDTLSLTPEQTI